MKTLSEWGGGGGTGCAHDYPQGLLNAEAGKFQVRPISVTCRGNVLSVTLRKSFFIVLGWDASLFSIPIPLDSSFFPCLLPYLVTRSILS